MIIICAWCRREKQPDGTYAEPVELREYEIGHAMAATHGICLECLARLRQEAGLV